MITKRVHGRKEEKLSEICKNWSLKTNNQNMASGI